MIYTTLARIREHSPCEDGWKKLCKSLGGIRNYGKDTPVSLLQILDSNGLNDALWCLRACDAEDFARDFARWCALQVAHLWEPPAVTLEYLNKGNAAMREAAWAAAFAAEAAEAAWSSLAAYAARAQSVLDAASAAQAAFAASAGQDARDARGAAEAAQAKHLRDMLAALVEAA